MDEKRKIRKIEESTSLFEYALSTNKEAYTYFSSLSPTCQNAVREGAKGLRYNELKEYISTFAPVKK